MPQSDRTTVAARRLSLREEIVGVRSHGAQAGAAPLEIEGSLTPRKRPVSRGPATPPCERNVVGVAL